MNKIIKSLSVICALSNMLSVSASEIPIFGERNTIELNKNEKYFEYEKTGCKINLYTIDATIDDTLYLNDKIMNVADLRQMGYMVRWDEKERTMTISFDINKRHLYKKEEVICNYKEDEKIYNLQKSDIKLKIWLIDGKLYDYKEFYIAGDTIFIKKIEN